MAGRRSDSPEAATFAVRALGGQGDGVVDAPGGPVFVRGVLPGERVRLGKIEKHGGVRRADLLEVIEMSPERVTPTPCAVAARCGGCPLMHASAALQSELKRGTVERALADIPRAGEVRVELDPAGRPLAYRRRARMAFRGHAIGYRAAKDRRIVHATSCPILRAELREAIERVAASVGVEFVGGGEISLGLGAPLGDDALPDRRGAVVSIVAEEAQPPRVYTALAELVSRGVVVGASLRVAGTAPASWGELREETSDADGRALTLAPSGFAQAQDAVNAAMGAYAIQLAEAEGARVLELFAGHGNLTLPLAARASEVVAIELDEPATRALSANLAAHALSARVITGDASRSIPKGAFDVVLLDPPRAGAKDAMRAILSARPARVVYVSCDPHTLARDLALLEGYVLDAARAFDMFPQTPHVETVVRMRRA